MTLSVGIAFIAGVLSFFSPCVFALVPGFIAYLAGINIGELRTKQRFNKVIFLNTLFYVLGFVTVFTLLGLALNSALAVASIGVKHWLTRIGGLVIIFFGLVLLGLIKIPWFDVEHKFKINRKAGYLTSFLFGMAFALGWTPCIGAVLGGIFTLAVSQPGSAVALLVAYSIGLALPFLLVGIFYSSAARFIKFNSKYTRIISIILGVLLILVGLLLFFNRLSYFGVVPFFSI
jgi:cytochrome c-type biogenesis protein